MRIAYRGITKRTLIVVAILMALLCTFVLPTIVSPVSSDSNPAVRTAGKFVAPKTAAADDPIDEDLESMGIGYSVVYNRAGSTVYLRKAYNSSRVAWNPWDGRIYQEPTYPYQSGQVFGSSDVDQFRSSADARCIKYGGPGYTDGYYKINGNYWYKISDLATVQVFSFYYSRCEGRPYFTHDGPGGLGND